MAPPTQRLALALAALALAGAGFGCGRPNAEAQDQPRKLEDPAELEVQRAKASPEKSAHKRKPAPMPETFAAFPRPKLTELDGAWLVDSEIPGERVAWLIDDGGSTLTIVDRHGRERTLGITLTSPCALRLTDEYGRSHTRSISLRDGRLLVSSKGAVAVAAPDGSLLVCAGHRTYQIAADGRCRHTTEMLGVWSTPTEPSETCKLDRDDQGPVLVVGAQRLRERDDGVWLDEIATASEAKRVADRDAAIAALAPEAGGDTSGTDGTDA